MKFEDKFESDWVDQSDQTQQICYSHCMEYKTEGERTAKNEEWPISSFGKSVMISAKDATVI